MISNNTTILIVILTKRGYVYPYPHLHPLILSNLLVGWNKCGLIIYHTQLSTQNITAGKTKVAADYNPNVAECTISETQNRGKLYPQYGKMHLIKVINQNKNSIIKDNMFGICNLFSKIEQNTTPFRCPWHQFRKMGPLLYIIHNCQSKALERGSSMSRQGITAIYHFWPICNSFGDGCIICPARQNPTNLYILLKSLPGLRI